MNDREKVIKGLECCREMDNPPGWRVGGCEECPYLTKKGAGCAMTLKEDAIALLKAQEPRVMTLEEVQQHYSLPPIFPDDFGMQEDYLNDIAPLYFDFPQADDSWIVHWRRYYDVADNIKEWAPSYGRKWRCWTGRPTEEQREATPWN